MVQVSRPQPLTSLHAAGHETGPENLEIYRESQHSFTMCLLTSHDVLLRLRCATSGLLVQPLASLAS